MNLPVWQSQIVVLAFKVQVGEDELVLDHLPNDASHFVTVHLDDRLVNLDSLVSMESLHFFVLLLSDDLPWKLNLHPGMQNHMVDLVNSIVQKNVKV